MFLQNSSATRSQSEKLESDLTDTKHELLKIREMLEMAEKVSEFSLTYSWRGGYFEVRGA